MWKAISRSYVVGDTGPAGGIVFYTTHNGLHGLEAAPIDQDAGNGASLGCNGDSIPGAKGTAIGTGAQNTAAIVEHDCFLTGPSSSFAAQLADSYELNDYSDWFLPSKDALHQWYLQKDVVGNLTSQRY